MAVWATSQRSTRSEIRRSPDGSLLRLRARRAMVPGTLGRFAGGASWPESRVCAAATARAPGNIPRKDLLRMYLLVFQLYHSTQTYNRASLCECPQGQGSIRPQHQYVRDRIYRVMNATQCQQPPVFD